MTNTTNTETTIRATIGKYQRVIMLTVAFVALAAYVLPFANLYDVADAQKVKKGDKDKDKKVKLDKGKSTSFKVAVSQNALINSGIIAGSGGGGGYDGLQLGNTAFNFLQQSQNICSGFANCATTQSVQFSPYFGFGG